MQPFESVAIDEISVETIYLTSVGGVARVRARDREFLLRDGDRLADGEVDGIDFITSTVAWLRFRRRVRVPGVPYRPIVWLVAVGGHGRRSGRERIRLGDELLGYDGFPPWTWELEIERAPRLLAEMLGSKALKQVQEPGNRIRMETGFGTVDVRFTSRPPQLPFVHDPGSRRDPFADLSAWTVPKPPRRGSRPDGIPGLLIDEIEVEGLFMMPVGAVAEVRSSREGFFLREGDQLWDGDVETIDLQEGVTFKQVIMDPTALKPFGAVVKRVDPQWIGSTGAARKAAQSSPPPKEPAELSSVDAILSGDDEVRWGPQAWAFEPAGRRDPFRSLKPGGALAASPPSALAKLTCDRLTAAEADELAGVLERAGQRLARYGWERGLVADQLNGKSYWARSFLDDVAQTASSDLARLFGELPGLASVRDGSSPPPAEMFALLGDLNLIAGRLPAAAESYGLAEGISPGQETLCGRLYDGKLYGAESFVSDWAYATRLYWLTGYLLAWDLASGRVVERHLLPALPEALAVENGELQITLRGGGSVRLAGQRLAAPVRVLTNPAERVAANQNGVLLAWNFDGLQDAGSSSPFEVRWWQFDDRLPLDLPELEKASRAAAFRDPTQPWHPFFLGQALWAQGRRKEAETLWRGIWDRGPWIAPYNELLWMAMLYERYGQREWADRAFDRALEERRLSRPITSSRVVERYLTGAFWLDAGLRDPERRYLWWRRLREISGIMAGDAFRAAFWADDRARRGDRAHAREELAYLERARRDPFDLTTRSAWLDYSLYVVVALVAMLFAQSAVLGRRLSKRLKPCRWRREALFHGLALLAVSMALYVAVSLSILAASYVGYLKALPFEPGDAPSAQEGQGTYEDRFRLTTPDLLRAWLTTGVVEPPGRAPALLIQKAQGIRSRGVGIQVLLVLAAIAAMFVIAVPAGLLLTWGRARTLMTRWIPGAAQVRAGARLKGYLLFGLFVFAVVPLAWLVVARTWGVVPAPGIVSANFFLRPYYLEAPFLPSLSTPDEHASEPGNQRDFERLRARSFGRLLAVYPGAGLFWSLVICALATSLSIHRFRPKGTGVMP